MNAKNRKNISDTVNISKTIRLYNEEVREKYWRSLNIIRNLP